MKSNIVFDIEKITNHVLDNRLSWTNEEEVRIGWIGSINSFSSINLQAERKYNDSSYNQIIIEFKGPNYFKGDENSSHFQNAKIERLKKYIDRKSVEENINCNEYIGIAIDGYHISFCNYIEDQFVNSRLLPVTSQSILKVIDAFANNGQRALTSSNLLEDFGLSSQFGINLLCSLHSGLLHYTNLEGGNKVKMLYEEWKTLFGQISGLTSDQRNKVNQVLPFDIENSDESIASALFTIHTYNSILIKLIGAEIVSRFNLSQFANYVDSLLGERDDNFFQSLENDIEKANLFENVGIKGFVSEAIFSWYLELKEIENLKNQLLSSIKDICALLSIYRFENINKLITKDLLKDVYQGLVPDTLRKSLGEFYTPDWMIDYVYSNFENKNWLNERILDPTCGSGSFLVKAINIYKQEAAEKGISKQNLLNIITNNIWGFDLNPLAVQSARVNYLIAISDLIPKDEPFEIEVPILLADSVYSPADNPENDDRIVRYTVGSNIANLTVYIPNDLAFNRILLDQVFAVMEESILDEETFNVVYDRLVKRKLIILGSYTSAYYEALKITYERVQELHTRNWNGIWFRIIRNFFWSAVAGKFSLIVGNPPWVRWSNLPVEYRERIKPTCLQYDIFSSTGYHGGNELDVSGMITYTVADKWLEFDGDIAFVITQSHFQAPSSEGFRSWTISPESYLKPWQVDDLKLLKPFSDAANKTSILFAKKENGIIDYDNLYPVNYRLWTAAKGKTKSIDKTSTLSSVESQVKINQKHANPVNDERSPWAIMEPGEFETIQDILGQSSWIQGRKGVTADLNGIYMVEVLNTSTDGNQVQIRTRPEAGRKNIGPSKTYWIESKFVYPLLKGASDFDTCYFKPKKELYFIIPNKGITQKYLKEMLEEVDHKSPKILKYFKDYKDLLGDRSTYKIRLKKWPYYAVYNVGEYSFAPFKVVWAEQSSKFKSAVVTDKEIAPGLRKVYVPDHKIYFADFEDEDAAYYLCGLLNSSKVQSYIESHTISIQVSNIFKHLSLPEYDHNNDFHRRLSSFTKEIHSENNSLKRQELIDTLNEYTGSII